MNESRGLDKIKLQEILNEITNLKAYSKELANSTKGEKIEQYISELSKNINQLSNKTEEVYENIFKTID